MSKVHNNMANKQDLIARVAETAGVSKKQAAHSEHCFRNNF